MEYLKNRFDRVPMRRLVKPEEIAAACAYLASDDASAITGIDLTVDCGPTAELVHPRDARGRQLTPPAASETVTTWRRGR